MRRTRPIHRSGVDSKRNNTKCLRSTERKRHFLAGFSTLGHNSSRSASEMR